MEEKVEPGKEFSWNPFAYWKAERERRREALREAAAREITEATAANERAMIKKLESIRFRDSRLPKEVLERRTQPDQPYGDLEYAAKGVINYLRKNPKNFPVDIRPFDEKLMTLLMLFKQSVEQGDQRAAYAARSGVVRGVTETRSRIAFVQPELAEQYVEINAEYLDQWIQLIHMAQLADQLEKNVQQMRKQLAAVREQTEKERAAFDRALRTDAGRLLAFQKLMRVQPGDDRTGWSPQERKLYRELLDRRLGRIRDDFRSLMLQQQEQDLMVTCNNVDILYAKVISLQPVSDPNMMSQFRDSVKQIVRKLAESDQRLDEAVTFMEEVHGQLQQLEQSPARQHINEFAQKEAKDQWEGFRERQENNVQQANQREPSGIFN